MKVALFITCLNDTLFPGTGKAVVRLLRRLGQEVDFPEAQTCCGQMHFNTGYRSQAAPLARGFAEAFAGYDAVVTPSASCGAMVRDWHPKLHDGPVPKVYELSEFLVDVLGVTDVGAYFPHRVTYHPTCHSLRMLHVGDRPLRLLREVRGIDLVELPEATECCGFGGTFALKNSEVSAAMCADKVTNVRRTGAEALCAADNSCLMHIGGALTRTRSGVRTVHLAEILASTEETAQ
ncbi:(Fe-S)-binding protein [Actinomadura sp. SCN-SB]|uniref:(Fe-S)-binding protein n=1 Tax=Actinomadura sp. SCN-SB TaxID=3373092 RepID=UPI003750DCA5